MIKNIIFDFDGVIVDSEILAVKAYSKYLINLGYLVNEEQLFNFAGKKTVDVIDTLSEKYHINDKDKFTSDIFKITSKIYLSDLKIVNGFSNYIKNSNRVHFIGSNSHKQRIIDGLKIVGLSKYFLPSRIYSFDMVKNPKPHPDIYLKVLNDNMLNINETVIIEDSSVGVKAAKAAGIKVFGLTAGLHWHSKRDINELYDNGALNVYNDFINLGRAIEDL